MSLWGRYMIDRIKHAVSHRVSLPVPPYGNTSYWDKVYKTLGPEDVYEWGGLSMKGNLLNHKYRLLYEHPETKKDSQTNHDDFIETSFGEAIGVPQQQEKSCLLLGCGNSRMGEDMAQAGWKGPLFQVDVSPRVLETMSHRCAALVDARVMSFVQDDASQLSAFDDESVHAVIDKGLVDALFCANEFDKLANVMSSVRRVLKPGCMLTIFSFSAPQHILPRMFPDIEHRKSKQWQSVQIRELEAILMYRYQKHQSTRQSKKRQNRRSNRQ